MSEWSYRASEWSRGARHWLGENARLAAMIASLALCVLVYVAFFLDSPFKTREMVILQRPAPQWNTIVFGLDRDYAVNVIEVVALTPEGRPAEIIWKIRRGADGPDLSAFAYGQALRGMEATVQATPLKEGERYRLVVWAPGARGELEFAFTGGDRVPSPIRRRRGG